MAQVPTGHYVDDFTACEPTRTITSGYTAFETIFKSLGLRMKPRKAQPPALSQKVLGVQMLMEPGQVTLSPHPERLQKIRSQIADHLRSDSMTPDQAQQLAGRILFLNTTLFGQIGQPILRPLYGRAYGGSITTEDHLNHGLRSALRALHTWLEDSEPRIIPFNQKAPQAILYTDAYFEMGDRSFQVSNDQIPQRWYHKQAPHYTNGWGFVVRTPSGCYYGCGRIPARILKAYCHRKAYIYMLEITAQLAAMTILQKVMPSLVISFCDNRAGLSALLRGFGKDPAINRILTLAWRLVHFSRWHLHMEWVASDNNISDKISRHDLELAEKFGWQEVAINMDPFYQILLKASEDDDYVLGGALQDLVACGASESFFKGTGNVADGRPSAV